MRCDVCFRTGQCCGELLRSAANEPELVTDEAGEQVFAYEEKRVGVDTGTRICAAHPLEPVLDIDSRLRIVCECRHFGRSGTKEIPVVDSKVLTRGLQTIAADLNLQRRKLGGWQLDVKMSYGAPFSPTV